MGKNLLASETSPYLKQHECNPVWWHAWGEEAFARARREGKPVFLSIGYSTCYWCHVMEKDSFEVNQVAATLNERFVSIKVDREERPDIDQIYMDALVGMTGHGGWPMSVFLTPEKQPFWAGTFFPQAQFIKILEGISEAWRGEPEKLRASAQHVVDVLAARRDLPAETETLVHGQSGQREGEERRLRTALMSLTDVFADQFDPQRGGFGEAPKFPPASQVATLLHLSRAQRNRTEGRRAAHMAQLTLERMACGGIFDQIGGGFHRYSTDAAWVVPHFEKMLYDNALLAVAYLEAYQQLGHPFFAEVARSTLTYMARDLRDSEGGFYAAEDAGEVGKEGEFYVWSMRELQQVFDAGSETGGGEQFRHFSARFPVTAAGNFEKETNILTVSDPDAWMQRVDPQVQPLIEKLLARRASRARPHLDKKVIAGWNGLAIKAFARGFQLLRDASMREVARSAARTVVDRLLGAEGLRRTYCNGESRHHGCLDDYAYMVSGLLELYRSDLESQWLTLALRIQGIQDERFWDADRSAYRYSEAPDVLWVQIELIDGATPSPNAISLQNLQELAVLCPQMDFGRRAQNLRNSFLAVAAKHPSACSAFWRAALSFLQGPREFVVRSSAVDLWRQACVAQAHALLPREVLIARAEAVEQQVRPPENVARVGISICMNGVCEPEQPDSPELRSDLLRRACEAFL